MPIFKNDEKARQNGQNGDSKKDLKEIKSSANVKHGVRKKMGEKAGQSIYGANERRVLVIYTGGTIGMVNNPEGFLIPQKNVFESLMRQFPQLHDKTIWEKKIKESPSFDKSFLILPKAGHVQCRILYKIFEYETLLDSSNMSESDWIKIAKDIKHFYEEYDGFVVLHGTDTLCYTASALSFMFENIGKGVVLTGAQIPIFEPRSDGVDNFVSSLLVAGAFNIPEVTIFFGSKLFRGNRTRKVSTDDFYAFDSPNAVPLVNVGIEFEVNKAAIFKPNTIERFRVNANMSKNVGLLRFFPSISTAVVQAFCQPPIEGIVIEAYGAGNIPSNRQDLLDVLEHAVKRGVIMVLITQCTSGAAAAVYETGQVLAERGVVCGSDMTPEAALTKLSYVLTKTDLSFKEKAEMMSKNIRGELTSVTALDVEDRTLKEALGACLNIQSPKMLSEVTEKVISSLLLYGIEQEDLTVVKKLLEMGADTNNEDSDGKTPLHEAILKGNYDIVEFLLKSGANVHKKRISCEGPLITAVQKGDANLINLLLKCGAHISSSDAKPLTDILTKAVVSGSLKELETLKMVGADLDLPDELLQTALHKAVLYNNPELAKYLVENGASRDKRDILNNTPLDYATQLKRELLIKIVE